VITALGLTAGAFTTLSWLPQVVRAFQTRSTKDFSWGWLLLFAGGVLLWLAYGLATTDTAVIAANAVTGLLLGGLAALKATHDRSSHRMAHTTSQGMEQHR
jgi:MtN3 and saliva related transmembrane protein